MSANSGGQTPATLTDRRSTGGNLANDMEIASPISNTRDAKFGNRKLLFTGNRHTPQHSTIYTQNQQYTHKTPAKRIRPSSPNPLLAATREITAPVTLPRESGGIFKETIYQRNIYPSDIAHVFTWEIINDPHGSDHLPILIKCEFNTHNVIERTHIIWKIEKADWNKYQQYLENTKELEGIREYTKLIEREVWTDRFHEKLSPPWANTKYTSKDGAYDNMVIDILREKLISVGITKRIATNLVSMYINRKVYIKMNDAMIGPRVTSLGLPQGSILSPLLYIIYSSDFNSHLKQSIRTIQFADDICIYIETTSIGQGHSKLSQAMELKINHRYAAVCIGITRKKFQHPANVQLGPYCIPYKSSVKYLGVIVDEKFKWKQHINQIIKKCENTINIMKVFCRSKWEADPNIALLFYSSLVRSVIYYGSIFYGSTTKAQLKKVDIIQNKCLRLSLGILNSTPINVLEAESGEPPLEVRRQFLSDKIVTRLNAKNSQCMTQLHKLTIQVLTLPYWNNKKRHYKWKVTPELHNTQR
ncbi:hypothetical protein NQ318_001796 [Aromia moschata]|uniref:Reverse transcriptase domain-containing protein n=1 Tax=Aromia moschata TaxID=1265417 RepID=A0AAV8XUF6_9CUCU|nr:hypothetical protein NQ318_001796 [Aromia moschata]